MHDDEQDAHWFAHAITTFDRIEMSAGSYVETLLVLSRRFARASGQPVAVAARDVARAIAEQPITIVPVDEGLAILGALGTLEFAGKPARLNYGDGFAYALAKHLDAPILCKGDDFVHTDVQVLRPPTV